MDDLIVLVVDSVADHHSRHEAVVADDDFPADEVEVVEVEEVGKILIIYLHFFRKCLY